MYFCSCSTIKVSCGFNKPADKDVQNVGANISVVSYLGTPCLLTWETMRIMKRMFRIIFTTQSDLTQDKGGTIQLGKMKHWSGSWISIKRILLSTLMQEG